MIIQFDTLEKHCEPNNSLFLEVERFFKDFIEPIYGNQKKILEKIRIGEDRKCQVLFCNGRSEGILVYKTENSDEFKDFGVSNALELKTLILNRKSKKFSGLFISILYKQIALAALENNSSCIFSTVSSEREDAFKVAKKLGFMKIHSLNGKNLKGVDEFLVCHKSPSELVTNAERLMNLHKKALTKNNLYS